MKSVMIPLVLIAFSLVALATAPALSITGADRVHKRAENRDEIYNLSELQRDQLQRNLDYYQHTLNDEGRAKMKTLHAALQEDKTGLREVLQNYHLWLLTLNAKQRDELFQAADAQQRIEIMQRMIRNRPVRDLARVYNLRFAWQDAPLSTTALEKVMSELKAETTKLLSDHDKEELESVTGINRNVKLLEKIRQLPGENSGRELLLRGTAPPPVEAVAKEIGKLGVSPEIETYVKKSETQQGVRLLDVLYRSLVSDFASQDARTRMNASRPTAKQLRELFDQIPNQAEKDFLLAMDAGEFQEALTRRYQNMPVPHIDEIVRQFTDQMPNFRRGGRRGSDGRGGPGGRGEMFGGQRGPEPGGRGPISGFGPEFDPPLDVKPSGESPDGRNERKDRNNNRDDNQRKEREGR